MISSETEYRKAREEVEHLNRWLADLENRDMAERKEFTSASVRRMIARIHEEIAEYEATKVSPPATSQNTGETHDTGIERRKADQD